MSDIAAVATAALPLIKRFEGLRLAAYPDPASGGDPWTIGYGATGEGIGHGVTWTQDQADSDLLTRVSKLAAEVCGVVTTALPDPSIAACVSLAYNIGFHAFAGSTVLRKINADDYRGAADAFGMWNKAAGRVFIGLVKRRTEEMQAFLAGIDIDTTGAA